ncbi:MAG: ParB/RepB/Spo0J family partition protein [Candidatus Beckwithbacteria bacterium]|nr:ParB/RepB/Spo0J family partition protein [Candidatus Beckwithbacteria bacterium]
MVKQDIIELDIVELQANPLQPRGMITPDSLMDLVDSIREHGILEPLIVAHTPAGYQIIAGERRWRAAKLAGLTHLPAIVKETSPQGMLEMALVENVQRTDLNAIDRAKAFERLMEEFDLSNAEIAKRIGKSPAYISNTLRLLSLPDALKDGLISGLITEGHARALASIDNKQAMIDAYKIILKESGSVRRAEDLSRRMKDKTGQKVTAPSSRPAHIVSEALDKMAEELTQKLGSNAKVKLIRTQRETRLSLVLKGSLADTESLLQKIFKAITKS